MVQLFRRPDVRLVLTSGTLLFVELVVLRWIPANVTYIGFFSNFLLMASFLGIGIGILLGRRFADAAWSPLPGLLLLVVGLILGAKLDVQLRPSNEIFFGLAESHAADVNFVVLPLVFVLVAAVMAALALPLGSLLRSMPPLRAYSLDIVGSIGGIALFTGLSVVSSQPPVWFGVLALLLGGLALARRLTRFSAIKRRLRPCDVRSGLRRDRQRRPLVSVLPHHRAAAPGGGRDDLRERDPPPGDARGPAEPFRGGAVLRPDLRVVPGSELRARARHRRRERDGHRVRAREPSAGDRRGRDRSPHPRAR